MSSEYAAGASGKLPARGCSLATLNLFNVVLLPYRIDATDQRPGLDNVQSLQSGFTAYNIIWRGTFEPSAITLSGDCAGRTTENPSAPGTNDRVLNTGVQSR